MNIKIREMNKGDFDDIVQACISEGWTTASLRREAFAAALDRSKVIVAYDDDVFAGYARVISDSFVTTFLCELLVAEDYRRKGIGTMLVNFVWELFPETRIDLISDADGFYEKLNFRRIGTGFRKSRLP